jgi:hypothetical protein
MPRYNVTLDIQMKVWQRNSLSMDFDGSPEELKDFLEARDTLPDSGDVDFNETENLMETEESLCSQTEGHPVVEVLSVDTEDDYE